MGLRFDLALVLDLAGEQGLEEAMRSGFVLEEESGRGAFRHALSSSGRRERKSRPGSLHSTDSATTPS